jgi:membrane protease YdiL (CAAX protease family)
VPPGDSPTLVVLGGYALAAAVAAAVAWLVDRRAAVSPGGPPPGFATPWRRAAAFGLVAATLFAGLLAPLALVAASGGAPVLAGDLSELPPGRLFLLHGLLAAATFAWGLLAYGGPEMLAAFGLAAPRPEREVAIGVVGGLIAWGGVLAAARLAAWLLEAAGGGGLLPAEPPALAAYLVAQPVALRLAVSLSAGLAEETFFRGFLQPRLGLGLTTALFVLAHAGWGQPLQLVAVALLSVVYGLLARARGNVWAAVVAHALFDAVQLLVVIPLALC